MGYKYITINYILNSGTNNANNPEIYNAETSTITLADPTRTGYTCGWNTESTGTTITYESGGRITASDIDVNMPQTLNLYAVCVKNEARFEQGRDLNAKFNYTRFE